MKWTARLPVLQRTGKRVKTVAQLVIVLSLFNMILISPVHATALHAPKAPRKPDVKALSPDQHWANPTLVSSQDAKRARAVFKALDRNRFKDARKQTSRIKDPTLKRILQWQALISRHSNAKFLDIKAFLKRQDQRHQDWPKRRTLLKRAEETMPRTLPPQEVLAWFKKIGGPVSNQGRVREAEAHLSLSQNQKAKTKIQKIWINGNFTKSQEKRFYRRHKKYIRKTDNVARLERLVWSGRFWPSRRQIWRVDKATRKLAIARLWLMRREGNVDKAIKNLKKTAPQLIEHAGLVFERARWRRRKNRHKEAADLILNFKGEPIRPDKWWTERALLARYFLQKNDPEKAYVLSSRHGLTSVFAAKYSEAEWLSGWIQLQFLNNPHKALSHFAHMYKIVNYPISMARGAYWSGRAAEALGHSNLARNWMEKAARYPTTFYGQLATGRLGRSVNPVLNPENIDASAKLKKAFHKNVLRKSVQILAEIGEKSKIRPFIIHLSDIDKSGPWQKLTADLASLYGRPDLAIRVSKESERQGIPLGSVSYPALSPPRHKAISNPVESPLVLAVIRQESAFYVDAKSRAGARGLMQVMPATAKRVARSNRLPYDRNRLTSDPTYNLIIGQVYLSGMVKAFKGSYPMALAAYNAGPHRVKRWIKSFGDPRTKDVDLIDWIEMIPYTETRNYVQRVLENLKVYRVKLRAEQAQIKRNLQTQK